MWKHKFQCFIWYAPLFHPCFWFVLCQSALSLSVFQCFVRECSHANVLFCTRFHTRTTHFIFTLSLFKFPKKHANWWFKRPKPMFTGWIDNSLNQSGHGGRSKLQQSFLFGSGEQNALVSINESMLIKMWLRNHVHYGAYECPNETSGFFFSSFGSLKT